MMNRAITRISIVGGALLLIGGCGGSSGGGSGSAGSGSGGSNNNSSTTVTFAISGGTPTAVATRVGSGSFTPATPVSGAVTLSLPSGTTNFAVAFVCPAVTSPSQQTYEYVYEASTLDGTSFSEACPATSSTGSSGFTTGTLTGSVDASAIPGVSYLNIDALNGTAETTVILGTPSGNFSFAAPVGSDDVQVLAYSSVLSGSAQTVSLVAAKVLTCQSVPGAVNGGSTVVLGTADQPAEEPITYSSVPSGYGAPTTIVTYEKGNGGVIRLASGITSQYPLLPAGALTSGGYYSLLASAIKSGTSSSEETLIASNTTSPGPQSFTFPPEWSYAGPVAATWPSFDLSYAGFSGKTGVLVEGSIYWSPTSNAQNLLQVAATQNFLTGSTTLATPDLTSVTGFLPAPSSGIHVAWSAAILQGSFPLLQKMPSNGTYAAVSNFGSYMAP